MAYYDKPFSLALLAGILRAVVRIPLSQLVIFLAFLLYLPLQILLPASLRSKGRCYFQKILLKTVSLIMGIKVIRQGPPPKGQVIFIANHLGVIDVFTVMAETGARLIAKESLRRIPIFGFFMSRLGVIFIRRNSLSDMHRVTEEMIQAYDRGDSLAFFPEGTTSRGQGIREFLGALFLPAQERGVPIHYGTIRFRIPGKRWPLASVAACQTEGGHFLRHLILLAFLPRTEVYIHYGEEPVGGLKRKALVKELERRMINQFEPMEQLPPEELARIVKPTARESQSFKSRPFLKREE
ncbi:MAG: lysophospholipid acyltransferase family protein [Spirochaetales bacterium]|nr:lysophospholipid acyltransferase family protein [Spirochaetales bacterium]